MSVSDYPDWQRVEQWVGSPFLNALQVAVGNAQVFGPFFVAAWEGIAFSVFQNGGGAATPFTVTLNFYDTVGGPVVATFPYTALAAQTISDAVPIHAAYVTFTFTNLAGARNFQMTVVPRRGFNPATRIWANDVLMVANIAAVAGPGTYTQMLNPVMAARGTFTAYTNAVAWSAYLEYLDVAGAVIARVAEMGTVAGRSGGMASCDLPPGPVRAGFDNFDAGNRVVIMSFIPQRI